MQPIGPLMIEHRLIERLLTLMAREFKRIKDNTEVDPEFAFVDPVFIDTAVDFLHTYADRCHHGKEEDLLFKALAGKDLAPEHRQIMEELIQEHAWAREATAGLVKAKEAYLLEKPGALDDLMEHLGKLVEFYPRAHRQRGQALLYPVHGLFQRRRAGRLAGPDARVRPPIDPRKIPRRRGVHGAAAGLQDLPLRRGGRTHRSAVGGHPAEFCEGRIGDSWRTMSTPGPPLNLPLFFYLVSGGAGRNPSPAKIMVR